MAILASSRELRCGVVRVVGRIILIGMTSITSIGCVIVIPVMASRTIICNYGMCPVQSIVIIVDRECSRLPTRIGCMTHGAVGRYSQIDVIWIATAIVCRGMTARTGIGCIIVIPVMACRTIVRDRNMRSCKRVHRAMIEGGWHPG